jgi:hypothetical protein
MTDNDRVWLQSLQLDDPLVQHMVGGYLDSWLRSAGVEVPEEHVIGVLEHFVGDASLTLADPPVLQGLGEYLREWLEIAGVEVPEEDLIAMLEGFVRGMRDDFASVARAVATIQKPN